MVPAKLIRQQLDDIKCNYTMWGSTEVAELSNVLMSDENICCAVNGYYSGGFGLLVVTNLRVLVVDKKPFTLNVEDIRFDMITEVNYNARFLLATIHMSLPTRTVYFTGWNMRKIYTGMQQIQMRVMEARSAKEHDGQTKDWFATWRDNLSDKKKRETIINAVASLARHAFSEQSRIPRQEKTLPFFSTSSNRGVNPYKKIPSLSRRRKYPAFYNY